MNDGRMKRRNKLRKLKQMKSKDKEQTTKGKWDWKLFEKEGKGKRIRESN